MFSSLFSKKEEKQSEWNYLVDVTTLDQIDQLSQQEPVLLFKHSTRCSISSMVLNKLESSFSGGGDFQKYFLDLIAHRDISNEIATRYGVVHQSPQALLVFKGEIVYEASHTGISYQEILSTANEVG